MKKKNQGKSGLLKAAMMGVAAASTLTLMTVGQSDAKSQQASGKSAEKPCYGVNKCKGTGDCGGKDHSCAGKNECKGKGWLKMNSETCLKIQDGRLKP